MRTVFSALALGLVTFAAASTGAEPATERESETHASRARLCETVASMAVEMNRARKQGLPQRRVEAAASAETDEAHMGGALVGVAHAVNTIAEDNDSAVRTRVRRDCRSGVGRR